MDDGHRDERRPGGHAAPRVIGKVIKGDGEPSGSERPALRGPRPGVLNAEEFEARTSAQRIVDDAKRTAAELLEAAALERDRVFEEARDAARAEVNAIAASELAKAKMQAGMMLEAASAELAALAGVIAEKILGRDLERDPELVLDIVATAVESARNSKAMTLRVNPKDALLLRERRPKLMELIGRTVDLQVKDDAEVRVGGCIIQTEFGTIDAQLKTQFDMLKNILLPDTGKRDGPK